MTKKLAVIGICIGAAVVIVWLFVYGPFNYNARNELRRTPDYDAQQRMGDQPEAGDFKGFDDEGNAIYEVK